MARRTTKGEREGMDGQRLIPQESKRWGRSARKRRRRRQPDWLAGGRDGTPKLMTVTVETMITKLQIEHDERCRDVFLARIQCFAVCRIPAARHMRMGCIRIERAEIFEKQCTYFLILGQEFNNLFPSTVPIIKCKEQVQSYSYKLSPFSVVNLQEG
jgi:hypothetical protein